jgi:hypothetical protein
MSGLRLGLDMDRGEWVTIREHALPSRDRKRIQILFRLTLDPRSDSVRTPGLHRLLSVDPERYGSFADQH